jgi:FtsH-binding integral membrane protein
MLTQNIENNTRGAVRTSFTRKENVESGLAFIVILLLVSLVLQSTLIVKISIGLLLLVMVLPAAFYPISLIWLNLSRVLGKMSSFVLLTLIFLLIVTPVGLIRRLIAKDILRLTQFKQSTSSVFEERNHRFAKDDILHPY